MKKLLVTTFLSVTLISCSNEQVSVEEGSCFSNGTSTYQWTMVTTWPKNFPGLGLAPENFSKYIEEMTCGRMKIKVYGAGEFVPAMGVFDAVSQGNVQLGHGASYYWTGKVKSSQFFTAVPFGLTAQEMNGWLHYGGGLELWQEAYEPFNLIPLAGGNTGVQMAGWFKKEINSLDDLKGLKMRIPGLAGEIFTRAGAETVTLPGNEIFLSLQQGVVDAAEWVGPYNDLTFGFHQVADYYYYPGWHEPGSTLEIIINKDAYDSLPEDLKAIIKYAARASNQEMLDEYTARNNKALNELIEKHNIELKKIPDTVLVELRRITDEVMEDFIADDEMAQKVYKSYKEFKEQVINYHRISEKAYIDTRELD
ncbi:MAG: TRAP transporter substrate-binding protein [SAR86 cluster bacterium]|jgi:TRAP-type mannitol/chloroaromatic compound transport system substrate-binding protein|nr:TRAP transporter substrate-binding protein [SAR86 cluster bacterium]|tara:strand:+ start:2658 stop:3755 length:1098 start_codon:yes stop_codon:yes gene_type:complete